MLQVKTAQQQASLPPSPIPQRMRVILDLLLLAVLSQFALLWLWLRDFPLSWDGVFHVYRAWELDRTLHLGLLYSRWQPDLFFGYGFPLGNFYAPLYYYLVEGIHLLGLDFILATKLVVTLSTLGIVTGMYLWARQIFRTLPHPRAGALLAATAYSFAPHTLGLLYLNGDFPAYLAIALYPFALLGLERFACSGRLRWAGLTLLIYTAMILTHNILSLIFTPVLIGYCALLILVNRIAGRAEDSASPPITTVRLGGTMLAVVGLALALTAFFWVPALSEKGLTHFEETLKLQPFNYVQQFPALKDFFSPSLFHRYYLLNYLHETGDYPHRFGLWQGILALAGLGALRLHKRATRVRVLAFTLALLMAIWLVLPLSRPLWDAIALLHSLQNSWRFMAVVALLSAILAGYAIAASLPRAAKELGVLILLTPLLAFTIAAGTVHLAPLERGLYPDRIDLAGYWRWEISTHTIGATSTADFMPRTVEEIPLKSPVTDAFFARQPFPATLPNPALTVLYQEQHGLQKILQIRASAPTTLVFPILYYPGWQVREGNLARRVQPSTPGGLIAIEVPAGIHTYHILFGETPRRLAADMVSLGTAVLLLALVTWGIQRRFQENGKQSQKADPVFKPGESSALPAPQQSGVYSVMVLQVLLALLILGASVNGHTLQERQRQALLAKHNARLSIPYPVRFNLGRDVTLVGYAVEPGVPGKPVNLVLYWQAQRRILHDYTIYVHLDDSLGRRLASADGRPVGGTYLTRLWQEGEVIADSHLLPIPPNSGPGIYYITVGMYFLISGESLPVTSGGLSQPGVKLHRDGNGVVIPLMVQP